MNTLIVSGQNVRVYGSVKNAINNTPISFANVVIDGTSKGTTTDIDGNFELLEIPQYHRLCLIWLLYKIEGLAQ